MISNGQNMGNLDYIIRVLKLEEACLLRDFLYEAIYLPEGTPPPPRSVIDLPELQIYISKTSVPGLMTIAW